MAQLFPVAPPDTPTTMPCYACDLINTDERRQRSCKACHHFNAAHKLPGARKKHVCYAPPCTAKTREECPTHHPSHPTKEALLVAEMKNNQVANTQTAKEMKEAPNASARATKIRELLTEYKDQEDSGTTDALRRERTNTITRKRNRPVEILDEDEEPRAQKSKIASVSELSPYAFDTVAAIDIELGKTELYQKGLIFRKTELTANLAGLSVSELQEKMNAFLASLK